MIISIYWDISQVKLWPEGCACRKKVSTSAKWAGFILRERECLFEMTWKSIFGVISVRIKVLCRPLMPSLEPRCYRDWKHWLASKRTIAWEAEKREMFCFSATVTHIFSCHAQIPCELTLMDVCCNVRVNVRFFNKVQRSRYAPRFLPVTQLCCGCSVWAAFPLHVQLPGRSGELRLAEAHQSCFGCRHLHR